MGAVMYSLYLSEGFAFMGYDIPGFVEDGAWMLWENSSVVVAVVVVAHPDSENGQFSSFITKSALPECADRSVSSSGCRRFILRDKKSYKKINYQKRVGKRSKTAKHRHSIKIPYRNIPHSYPLKGAVMYFCLCRELWFKPPLRGRNGFNSAAGA